MVGVNVPVPVPVSYYSFGGWKASLFGDTHMYGPEGINFYTRTKVVTSRWPDPARVPSTSASPRTGECRCRPPGPLPPGSAPLGVRARQSFAPRHVRQPSRPIVSSSNRGPALRVDTHRDGRLAFLAARHPPGASPIELGGGADGLRGRTADHAAGCAGDRSRQAGRGVRVQSRVDVRHAHPVAGAIRHLQPDPGRDAQRHGRPDGHQPGNARLDRHRQPVRHAERDVRQPHRVRHRPWRLGGSRRPTARRPRWRRCATAVHVIRELANGRSVDYKGRKLRFPWARESQLEVWVAAYGPKALALTGEVGDGFILQLADLSIAEWTIKCCAGRCRRRRSRSRRHHHLRGRTRLRHRRQRRRPGPRP